MDVNGQQPWWGGGECKFFAAHMNLLLITSLIGKIDPHELVEK
jgi:hypothetical protein